MPNVKKKPPIDLNALEKKPLTYLSKEAMERLQTTKSAGVDPTVRDVEQMELIVKCLQFRKGGATYANIAKNLGIGEDTARKYVVNELERLASEMQEAAYEHRQMQLERLSDMILGYWPRRQDPRFGAAILTLMNRQDALMGVGAETLNVNLNKSAVEQMDEASIDAFLAAKLKALEPPIPINKVN